MHQNECEDQSSAVDVGKMGYTIKCFVYNLLYFLYSRERIAYLQQQLEIETQIRKQAEALNEQLHSQMLECQREMEDVVIKCNSASTIPENCSLVSKDELQSLLQE